MEQIYLTRRNLETLLSKLDRAKVGEITSCTICKRDYDHPKFPFSFKDYVNVTAVEDEDYYTDRVPGEVFYKDEPKQQ
jgi:hypothetical protein